MDWQKLISELMATGLKQAAIAKLTGTDQATIYRLRTGQRKDIMYTQGAKIVELARAHGIKVREKHFSSR